MLGTTRSTQSNASVVPREDSDVYHYALRLAVLHANTHLATPSSPFQSPQLERTATAASAASSSASAVSSPPPPLRQSTSFRPTGGWTRSVLSLGEVFKDPGGGGGGGSIKFPKEFLKVIDSKMERVARGADPAHTDPLFRQTIGVFYGKFADPAFQRPLAKNRQTEELILTFSATASTTLRKQLPGDEWKDHLDHQVGQFILLVRDALKSRDVKNCPPELLQRLDAHCAKLATPDGQPLLPSAPPPSSVASPSLPSTSRTTLDQPAPIAAAVASLTTNIHEMPLVKAVGQLFGKTDAELTRDVIPLRRVCTEQAAFNDLKLCINNVAQGARFPARREDFDLDASFQTWKRAESAQLSELIVAMISRNPSLRNSAQPSAEITPTPSSSSTFSSNNHPRGTGSISNRSSVHGLASPSPPSSTVGSNSGDEELISDAFTFVPPDPKFYYKRLYEIALDHDYDHMSDLPPDEAVPLTILTPLHEDLLRECELRWRVIPPVRASTFVALITQHYKSASVPVACVAEALDSLDRVAEEWDYDRWPWADRNYLFKNLLALFNILLPRFFEIFEGILELPFSDVVSPLEQIHANPIFREEARDLSTTFDELRVGMRTFVTFAYEEKQADVDSLERVHDLQPFISMLVWIKDRTKQYAREFPDPVLGEIDHPAIFVSVAGPMFVAHLEASREALLAAANQAQGAASDEDLLGLYRGTIQLEEMHDAFCPNTPLRINFSAWFEPYVRRWLSTTDTKTMEWVKRAIDSDKFEPEEESTDKHSSSIIDLIASCQSATDFILALDWPNEYENARYLTGLSQTIAKSIQQYSSTLEIMFNEEMRARPAEGASPVDINRPSAWLTKAKLVVQGDAKIEPFVFKPESLVKLNNIQAARKLLDRMYTKLDAEKVATIVEQHAPPLPDKAESNRYLFTVKVVLAESLGSAADHRQRSHDPFLILSDHVGHRVAKTRTLYETNDPRWDETFDVSVRGDLWLRATIYHRNLVEEHEIVARAYIHLNPPDFSDYLPRDVWLRLEGKNEQPLDSRLLLRISMEGEKDDIRFYFGRAFRFLKRAENDMTRLIVDKMSPFIRHYLSQTTLKTLLKTQFEIPDIDLARVQANITKTTGKLTALVRGALTTDDSALLIPSVEEYRAPPPVAPSRGVEAQRTRKGRGPLTDQEIEDAIGPLLDYFNDTFRTLNETLSAEAWELVSTRLWKEILSTIEALVLPPLSDQLTEMKPLSEKELDIVYKWRQFLLDFFHLGGQGLPMATLRNPKYEELGMARMYYDWTADALCEEAVRAMQRQLERRESGTSALGRSKSVYNQRNLGTIKAHKKVKAQAHSSNAEIILRILRMHHGQGDFLSMQIGMLNVQAQPQRGGPGNGSIQRRPVNGAGAGKRLSAQRGGRGGGRAGASGTPGLPTIPDQYR